jgi:predicted transcriptional regulator
VSSGELAAAVGRTDRYVRESLGRLERVGLVKWLGSRGGWHPTDKGIRFVTGPRCEAPTGRAAADAEGLCPDNGEEG